MSRKLEGTDVNFDCFPRVSGDEPPTRRGDKLADAFSPRERG